MTFRKSEPIFAASILFGAFVGWNIAEIFSHKASASGGSCDETILEEISPAQLANLKAKGIDFTCG